MNAPANQLGTGYTSTAGTDASASGVSWAAIVAGAFVAAAISLILLALGAGAGMSSPSPWSVSGVSPATVGMGALLWLTLIEIVSSGLGGYMAGRLRTKWVDVHTDEVYFRDTAHGFIAWSVALVITAAFLGSAASAMVGAENRSPNASRSEGIVEDANRYYIDSLFRSTQPPASNDTSVRAEAGLIFAHALRQRELNADDKNYLADTVSAKTGISRPEAEKRVTDVFGQDQEATERVRKAVAHSLYWLFVALLLGAFSASLAATFGGRQRDRAHRVA
jgi:hypothetical protein